MSEKNNRIYLVSRWIRIPVIVLYLFLSGSSATRVTDIELDFGFHTFFENSKELPMLKLYKEKYGEDINLIIVIIKSGNIFTRENLQTIDRLTRFFGEQPEVTNVTSLTGIDVIRNVDEELRVEPFMEKIPDDKAALDALRKEAVGNRELHRFIISDDGGVTAVVAEIEGHLKRQNRLIGAVEEWIAKDREGNPHKQLQFYLGGVNVIQREYEKISMEGIVFNGIMILCIMSIILLIQYRNITGVFLPLACALVSLVLVLGLMSITKEPINIVNQLVPELMLILGIADGIYVLSRYFEEREKHAPRAALDITMRHMIVACFFTSLTTAVGFGSLYAADMYLIKRFGIYCAVGVMISYVNIILINSSLLSFLKKPGKSPGSKKEKGGKSLDLTGACLKWVAHAVVHHQKKIAIVSLIIIGASIAFIFKIRMQHKILSELDKSNCVVKTNEMFEENLFGILSYAIEFEGPPDSMVEPATLKKLDRLVGIIEKDGGVRKTLSLTETLKEFNMKWMDEGDKYFRLPKSRALAVQYLDFLEPDTRRRIISEDYSETRIMIMSKNLPSSWWYDMMDRLTPRLRAFFPAGGDITWRYNGSSHLAAKTLHHLIVDLLTTMALSIVIITILMTLLFRSIRIGLISMAPNIIPLTLTFGFMGAAGIELRPATAIIFAVSLGIAVNDTIHLMARFREEIKKKDDIKEAVITTVINAGRPAIYTSALLIGGYCVLLFSDFIAVRHFSLLITVTLLSALWADLFLTPILLLRYGKKPVSIQR